APLVGICFGPHDCRHNNIVPPGDTLMLRLTLCLVGATLGLCGLFAATALPARAQLQLQAQGRSEGAFVFYVGGPTAPWEAKAKIFEQRYPGIRCRSRGASLTCSTKRSTSNSRTTSSRLTSRSSRRCRTSCAGRRKATS